MSTHWPSAQGVNSFLFSHIKYFEAQKNEFDNLYISKQIQYTPKFLENKFGKCTCLGGSSNWSSREWWFRFNKRPIRVEERKNQLVIRAKTVEDLELFELWLGKN